MGLFETNEDDENDWVDYLIFFILMLVGGAVWGIACAVAQVGVFFAVITTLIVGVLFAFALTRGKPESVSKTG